MSKKKESNGLPEIPEEGKQKLIERWKDKNRNPPSLKESVQLAFGPEYSGKNTQYARSVKKFIAENLHTKPRASYQHQKKRNVELSDAEKEMVENYVNSHSPLEIAKELFGSHITNLHKEYEAVEHHYKNCNAKMKYVDEEELDRSKYKPPKTLNSIISRVNKYLYNGLEKEKLTPQQEKHLKALIGHLHTSKFIYHVNSFDDATERELFESSFIRYMYDSAADVDESEADQFCNLSIESIWQKRLEKQIRDFDKLLEKTTSQDEKLSMSIAESAKGLRSDYNTCLQRQQRILSDLKQKRSDRLKQQVQQNESILNLVEMWRNENYRQKMLQLAERKRSELKDEVDRLESVDELKFEAFGIGKEEITEE